MHRHVTSAPSPDILERLQQALGSAFIIERELGGGGMSRIFLARELALGRQVVVKLLPPEYAEGVNGERFHHEILLAARLQHPHIVPILAAGEMNGVPYYTMPFIEGESLRWRLLRGDRFGSAEVTRILHDVIDALAYAHEHGVVHRDIKPDNVLMSRQHALITDFGVAKALCVAHEAGCDACIVETESGMAIGTPAYMAPEQAAADPSTDHRADLYGFGVLGYELLTGRPPFSGREPLELLAAHVAETPIPIQALRPEVPAPLAELVMRCLEKQPERRPASAAGIRDALETMTITTEPVALPARPPRFAERMSRLAAAVTLALLGGGGTLLHLARGETPRQSDVVADTPAVRGATDASNGTKARVPVLGPGMLEARWLGPQRPAIELPAVVAVEPDQKVRLATKHARSGRTQKLATTGAAEASAGDERVSVVLQSRHGTATIAVGSLANERRKLEATAHRLQMLEAMVGDGAPVLASLPAIDSIAVERKGDRTNATVFVRDAASPTPAPAQPRKRLKDGSAAGTASSAPAAALPGAPSAHVAPTPARVVPSRIVGLLDVDAALEQARARLSADVECEEEKARRLREQTARAKRGATG